VRLVALSGEGTVLGLSTEGKLWQYSWEPEPDAEAKPVAESELEAYAKLLENMIKNRVSSQLNNVIAELVSEFCISLLGQQGVGK
jgi:hypothetical protein